MPRRRKRSAWGALTQVDAGTWRIRFWASGPDGYRRRSKTIRGTRLDAERARSELMLAHSEDAPCPTVGEVWERWMLPDLERRAEAGDVAATTITQYRYGWQRHVAPQWAHVQCDAVRPLAVQQWLYGITANAAKQGILLLRMALDYAVRYELVEHNPCRERYVMPSKSTVERQDAGVWTLDELGEVWRAVRGQWYEAAFLLCAFGGLRVGEALGVRAEDVGAEVVDGMTLAMVRVERQAAPSGVTDALKTPQSRRTVPVPGRAGARLLELAATMPDFLSGDGMGGPSTRYRLRSSWASAPLPDRLRHPFRNLRNSWQTNMRWTMRMPPWLIEPVLGHRVQGVTGQHYDRPAAQMFAEAIAEAYRARPFDAGWTWAD
jgi:integrase